MFKRYISNQLKDEFKSPEIIIITGPRRVGKTTLLNQLEQQAKPNYSTLYVDFTDSAAITLWQDHSIEKVAAILSELPSEPEGKIIFFDEIQYLPDSGKLLKIFYDHFPGVKVYATGSSSFLLLQSIGESLAGRKKLFTLYPLMLSEIAKMEFSAYWEFKELLLQADKLAHILEQTLIYGGYPGIYLTAEPKNKVDKLKEISDSLLFKDLLIFEHIKKPRMLVELAKLLAYQIGNLVNPNELSATLGISRKTVLDYIELLERFFVIQRVYPYERNLRNVIKKQFKVYFFDNGIRNAIIGDFRLLSQREDAGMLLENAVALGLKKRIAYDGLLTEIFFWRDYDGKEVDFLLKNQEAFQAIEVKYKRDKIKPPKNFTRHFPSASFLSTNMQNAYRFCL